MTESEWTPPDLLLVSRLNMAAEDALGWIGFTGPADETGDDGEIAYLLSTPERRAAPDLAEAGSKAFAWLLICLEKAGPLMSSDVREELSKVASDLGSAIAKARVDQT